MRLKTSTAVFVALVALMAMVLSNAAVAKSVRLTTNIRIRRITSPSTAVRNFTTLMCDSYDKQHLSRRDLDRDGCPVSARHFRQHVRPRDDAGLQGRIGLIYKSMLGGTLTTLQAQWAVWGLFSANAQNNPLFTTYGGAATDATYLALAGTASNSAYNGLLLYTPLGAKPGSGPQEFIGYSAVPTSPCDT